jgi:hypothetical protein
LHVSKSYRMCKWWLDRNAFASRVRRFWEGCRELFRWYSMRVLCTSLRFVGLAIIRAPLKRYDAIVSWEALLRSSAIFAINSRLSRWVVVWYSYAGHPRYDVGVLLSRGRIDAWWYYQGYSSGRLRSSRLFARVLLSIFGSMLKIYLSIILSRLLIYTSLELICWCVWIVIASNALMNSGFFSRFGI